MERVRVVYTGGTIGGARGSDSAIHVPKDDPRKFEDLVRAKLPPWAQDIEWDMVSIDPVKLSENMTPTDWPRIAQLVDEAIQAELKGVVVAHGTDTLVYSAAALSVMLHNPPIPIALTGANKPLEDDDTDVVQNLSHALFFAAQADIEGVFVSFSGIPDGASLIVGGASVHKDACRPDCFQPVHGPPVARIIAEASGAAPSITINRDALDKAGLLPGEYAVRTDIEPSVALLQLYPGFDPKMISEAVERGAKGVVLSAYGVGTACTEGPHSILAAVEAVVKRCIPVLIVSQHYGSVSSETYDTSTDLADAGCVGLGRMTPEVAVVTLMWLLSQGLGYDETCEQIQARSAGQA